MLLKGIAASKGYAIGQISIMSQTDIEIDLTPCKDANASLCRLKEAIQASRLQLQKIRQKTADTIGEEEAKVFDSHMMFLEDPEFIGAIEETIQTDALQTAAAIEKIKLFYKDLFDQMDNAYMKERAADIVDVGNRLIRNALGIEDNTSALPENTIIVAHDLTPSDTAQLDKSKVIGFLTDIGGVTSHSAIMARSLEICAIVGLNDVTSTVKNGQHVIIDGINGVAILDPDAQTLAHYESLKATYMKKREDLKKYKNLKLKYDDGRDILIAGNIGSVKDLDAVIENGADGIGLFRTEFVFMDRETMPTEDEQFIIYKTVAEKMAGKPVVIRTLDIGGDKQIPYLELDPEMNPFLGLRAIRLCFKYEEMFKAQIKALLRAGVYGDIQIMFPMIGTLNEILQAKAIIEICKKELSDASISFNATTPIGIMIEIPSAAIVADLLAKEVDFFSIGTNDLIQYTLAVDRMNSSISHLYDPMNPAVLRLIKMSIDAAHEAGIWCGMCGEMAGDLRATKQLFDMGLDEFSMSASNILDVKEAIAEYLNLNITV